MAILLCQYAGMKCKSDAKLNKQVLKKINVLKICSLLQFYY